MDTRIERAEIWRLQGHMPVECEIDAPEEPVGLYGKWRPTGLTLGTRTEKSTIPVVHRYLKLITAGGHEGLCLGVSSVATELLNGIMPAAVLGRDAMDAEHIWTDIQRAPRFAARGAANDALAFVDLALWDLRAKCLGLPAAALMGGTRRKQLPAYVMTLHLPGAMGPDLGRVRAWAERLTSEGYRYQKWCVPGGNDDHADAFRRSVEFVRVVREAVGNEADFILCAGMGKKLKAFFKAVEPYEPMHIQTSSRLSERRVLREIRELSTVPVGTGQGIQNRWELLRILEARCVDVLGCDPVGAGGLTELRKIATMAEAYGVQLYPHCGIPENMHVVASLPRSLCPMVEYLITWMPHRAFFEDYDFVPKDGKIALPEYPGIFKWAEDRIEKREMLASWSV